MMGRAVLILFALLFTGDVADAATGSDFVAACKSSSNLDQAICECTAKKAQEQLSPKGFDFLVASLQGDDEKTAKLRNCLSLRRWLRARL